MYNVRFTMYEQSSEHGIYWVGPTEFILLSVDTASCRVLKIKAQRGRESRDYIP